MPAQRVLVQLHDLCRDAPSRADACDFWLPDNVKGTIYVLKNKNKNYTLHPTNLALRHHDHDDPGMRFFVITSLKAAHDQRHDQGFRHCKCCAKTADDRAHVRQRRQVFALKPAEKGLPLFKCVFIALGWLVENEKEEHGTKKSATNYVVLLNLSTQPTSLWLLYDYHMWDEMEDKVYWTNRLEYPYNKLFYQDRTEERLMSEIQDEFDVGDGPETSAEPFNFRAYYTNRPEETSCKAADNDQHNRSYETDDCKKGYFSLPRRFDLALLASDVEKWSSDGIDPTHVKRCLESSSVCYGESLRIRSLKKRELATFKKNHKRFNMGILGI